MKRIKNTRILKEIPKISETEAVEVWKITDKLLPPDCLWRGKKSIREKVLQIVSYQYLSGGRESITVDKICFQCVQAHSKLSCPHRRAHLH